MVLVDFFTISDRYWSKSVCSTSTWYGMYAAAGSVKHSAGYSSVNPSSHSEGTNMAAAASHFSTIPRKPHKVASVAGDTLATLAVRSTAVGLYSSEYAPSLSSFLRPTFVRTSAASHWTSLSLVCNMILLPTNGVTLWSKFINACNKPSRSKLYACFLSFKYSAVSSILETAYFANVSDD